MKFSPPILRRVLQCLLAAAFLFTLIEGVVLRLT